MTMSRIRPRMHGFSMIELMVTLAVMVILLIVAVPMISSTLEKSNVTSASNALLADISYARSEAVNRGTDVSMCATTDGATCDSSSAFDTGWLIYTYSSSPLVQKAYDNTKSNDLLLRHTGAQSGVSIQTEATIPIITFGPQGEMKPDNTPTAFDVCYRAGSITTGTGQSTAQVPGIGFTVQSSGSAFTQTLAAGAACTGPAPSTSG
jgi:type IV fimbrial biogenesis protein FimT